MVKCQIEVHAQLVALPILSLLIDITSYSDVELPFQVSLKKYDSSPFPLHFQNLLTLYKWKPTEDSEFLNSLELTFKFKFKFRGFSYPRHKWI